MENLKQVKNFYSKGRERGSQRHLHVTQRQNVMTHRARDCSFCSRRRFWPGDTEGTPVLQNFVHFAICLKIYHLERTV